jgi:hypothetical protein
MTEDFSNFVLLSHSEVIMKLKNIADQKDMIKMWVKGIESIQYRVCELKSVTLGGKKTFMITVFSEGEDADKSILNKNVFVSFWFNEIDYFTEGTATLDEVSGNIVVFINKEVFRSEKRNNERLLTFPHHHVYAYFVMGDLKGRKEETNVVSLKKDQIKQYEIRKEKKNKLKSELAAKLKKNVDDLNEFRALDISRSGIAFITGQDEKVYFDENENLEFYVLFDNNVFRVKEARLVYAVKYSATKEKVSYKIGLNFKPVENLTKKVMEALRDGDSENAIQKEFENFIED